MNMLMLAFAYSVVSGISYAPDNGTEGVGNLYLPDRVSSSTPIVLMIHGGGFNSGDRYSISGIADFFAGQLGYAVFNIEYRLASENARWPACGNDCIAAANYVLSSEFKSQYGFGYDRIWLCGGSAGGHLALWTLVNLASDKVAGAIAISPIGDPGLDYAKTPTRYSALFDGAPNLDAMNPCLRVGPGMAPVLITHATGDNVVPIESSKAFAQAYRAAGNSVEYFEYPCDLEPNESGHCIWKLNSSPHMLIDSLERKIAYFARRASTTCEWTARAIDVVAVNRTDIGTVSSVDLRFGAGNGLTNRLYVAYGDSYGGNRIGDWQQYEFIREVADDTNALRVKPPKAKCCKFFLDVPFPGGKIGVPVKHVTATGTQYVDTGVKIRGGDALRCTYVPSTTGWDGGVMGTRTALNKENVCAFCYGATFQFDYNSKESDSNNYANYRIRTSTFESGKWYDLVLSADERSASVEAMGRNMVHCPDEFETAYPCWLFKISGSPSISSSSKGAIRSFSIERDGDYVASYVPYRFDDTYGFFDRVSGRFVTSVDGSGALNGSEDAAVRTPLTSATETIREGMATDNAEARTVTVRDVNTNSVELVFGADNGLVNNLYLGYGRRDCGIDPLAWDHLVFVASIPQGMDGTTVTVPDGIRHCRFFLVMPCNGIPLPMACVTGNGTGYFDIGFTIKGGDELSARVMPTKNQGLVFGSRHSAGTGSDRNVVAMINTRFLIDYTNSDVLGHRCTTSDVSLNRWYDIVASPSRRTVTDVLSGDVIGENSTECSDSFETSSTCRLFSANGNPSISTKFSGSVASFKIMRDGGILVSLVPCQLNGVCGFYDMVNGGFISASEGDFSGGESLAENPFLSFSDEVRLNIKGFVLCVK